MGNTTKQAILAAAKKIFAEFGYEGLSMRRLAESAGVSLSVTYHHYKDKDELLRQAFEFTSRQLGQLRAKLPYKETAVEMLYDRILFQIDNSFDIVFMLKYYLHFRRQYAHNDHGYLPVKAYLHITEVLDFGICRKEFFLSGSIEKEAKVIAHAINGFLLEYYPIPPDASEREELATSIHDFALRALREGAPVTA